MLTLIGFTTLSTLFVGYDVWMTLRRLKKYGLGVELNPLTKLAAAHVGLQQGVFLGIVGPHLLFTVTAFAGGLTTVYAFYTGYLANHFIIQRASLQFEARYDALVALRDRLKGSVSGSAALPPTDSLCEDSTESGAAIRTENKDE